ncbi:hypothetical protein M011DRAFT_52708 [Sporormia fimetaria CBS 119925]|uniref:Uncharacterized protein n=1 Tax=Sporormia fimetaria CBS 119925 TaxID=1340428 RepID=A0A6A6VCD1_9PLEO|nr:hypothetical protein M011DRAFT_52708 [Sporormia fimetaria CBS 119925]
MARAPLPLTPEQQKRKRKRAEAKRKRRYGKPYKIRGLPQYTHVRTLSRQARREIKQKLEKTQYIIPWLSHHDPHDRDHPRGGPGPLGEVSLLVLPRELRQQILGSTMSDAMIREHSRAEIGSWIGKLASVCSVLRNDMRFVRERWKGRKIQYEQHDQANPEPSNPHIAPMPLRQRRNIIHARAKAKMPTKEIRRKRDRKCWFCLQRHWSKSKQCPVTQGERTDWLASTR